MKTKNNLPENWCVLSPREGLGLYRETVISFLNSKLDSCSYAGAIDMYYGIFNGKVDYKRILSASEIGTVLTLEQFIEMSKPIEEWTPKRGELVEVSDNGNDWIERIYILTLSDHQCNEPYLVVALGEENKFKSGGKVNSRAWVHVRQIKPTHKEVTLQEIADKFGVDVKDLRIKE